MSAYFWIPGIAVYCNTPQACSLITLPIFMWTFCCCHAVCRLAWVCVHVQLCVCVCVCVCMCAELLLLVSAILGFPYISDPCIFHYLLMILIIVFSALTVDCYVSCLFTVIVKVFPVNFFFYPCKIKFSRSSSLFFSPSHTHTHK